jgi:molybdate transport system substrate-binding protein
VRTRATLLAAMMLGLGACGSGASSRDTLTVFAAASLTEAFTKIAGDFEERSGIEIRLSFGPSDGLATQIQEGAPADVFAAASPRWMDVVAADPGVSDRADLARNVLVVITPVDDPAGVDAVDDLARPGIKLVLAAEGVPAGDYARELLANAGVARRALANVVSNEDDVKGVVQKVALGEADAGIVYRTDVTPAVADDVEVVDVPDDVGVVAVYPIAVVDRGAGGSRSREFVAYVLGPGQDTLRAAGFLPP